MKTPFAKSLFLIVRGPKSEFHKAPYHPVIVCSRTHTAKWEAQKTDNGHTVFECMADNGNWLLVKYQGYNIDHGNVCSHFTLFDGKESKEVSSSENIEAYLKNAVWWSYDHMPKWIEEKGVSYATDAFTKKRIYDDAGTCLLPYSKEKMLKDKLEGYDQPFWLLTNSEIISQ